MQKETILNVFPTADDLHRLVVAVQQEHASSRLVLRQETYAEDVGWFVQSCVAIEPEQVAGLKMALSSQGANRDRTKNSRSTLSRVPAILRFNGELAGNAG
ncbi:hypothetical protein N9B17_05345 [Rhodopirellula sp.]|nr:hypothetical protein [Rhodopirellula sp.]